ncbi:MAG: hypothetical protein IPP28_02690 [Xanthomonadales bacterium]|jgi:hypothetical protein|nr:hypothetical protein [Xanthomonadales bacterium]MBP7623919.1 hypothetical protein [Xanthomonadales bacterium]
MFSTLSLDIDSMRAGASERFLLAHLSQGAEPNDKAGPYKGSLGTFPLAESNPFRLSTIFMRNPFRSWGH